MKHWNINLSQRGLTFVSLWLINSCFLLIHIYTYKYTHIYILEDLYLYYCNLYTYIRIFPLRVLDFLFQVHPLSVYTNIVCLYIFADIIILPDIIISPFVCIHNHEWQWIYVGFYVVIIHGPMMFGMTWWLTNISFCVLIWLCLISVAIL